MTRAIRDNFAPYAPASAIIDVIRRFRDRGLPDPVTLTALEQVGVAPTMTSRTLQALAFLQLVDEGGNRTQAFERLRRATSEEYPQILAEIVRNAYLRIFSIVDPVQDGSDAIADAFRPYDPANQRDKMISLFMALCAEAGIIERTGLTRSSQKKPRQSPSKSTPATPQKRHPAEPQSSTSKADVGQDLAQSDTATDYRLISAIIQQLPRGGHWTPDKRKKWLDAMTSAVDLIIEVQQQDNETGDSASERSEGQEHVPAQ